MPDATPTKTGPLGKKVGPLPVVGWIGAAGATYLVYHLYQTHQANLANASGTTTSSPAIDPTTGVPYATELANATSATSTATPSSGLPASWEAGAIGFLTNKKGGNLSDAQAVSALQDWLNGQPIPYNAANALSIYLAKVIPAGYNLETLPTIHAEAKPVPVTTSHTPSEKVTSTAVNTGVSTTPSQRVTATKTTNPGKATTKTTTKNPFGPPNPNTGKKTKPTTTSNPLSSSATKLGGDVLKNIFEPWTGFKSTPSDLPDLWNILKNGIFG